MCVCVCLNMVSTRGSLVGEIAIKNFGRLFYSSIAHQYSVAYDEQGHPKGI